ncbi:ImmA/IrrE family metallo-endopeptidase [Actinomadura sp. KC06]|uniref:helix-turn-helix domain-containing protein n=1 Tax=Actinomadura sp. KC06 TaxID=2530369 RepID=UPI00104D90E8|nr:XRE family transcriptional regulator [Actinomadura sp. KC06]TDD32899.1 ImmA/IrrE family metallo-endopeptidase [Actinomadura sp. KC06]
MDEPSRAHATMLALARESRGLSQTSLAHVMTELAGETISQGYVSKAEAGKLAVDGERLALYARALGYPTGVLCVDAEMNGVGIGLVHHRKKASLGAKELRRIHAQLALARLQVRGLVEPQVRGEHRFEHIEVNDLNTPAEAAQILRKLWGLPAGPVTDLVGVVEDAGGMVLVRDLDAPDLDAVSQWDGQEAPLFLLGAHAPADRFRFSFAHEIGHVVMHAEPGVTALQERQADEFASEFLMPAADIAEELHGPLTLAGLLALKQRWGVSMAALARTALTLSQISEWQYRNLVIEMSTLGYRKQEPGELHREVPHVITDTAQRLVDQHGLNRAADQAGLLPQEYALLFPPDPDSAGGDAGSHDVD